LSITLSDEKTKAQSLRAIIVVGDRQTPSCKPAKGSDVRQSVWLG
jgi:hypothetical protein